MPLWTELLGYVKQRPILGYGYDSFWNARHIEDVTAVWIGPYMSPTRFAWTRSSVSVWSG